MQDVTRSCRLEFFKNQYEKIKFAGKFPKNNKRTGCNNAMQVGNF